MSAVANESRTRLGRLNDELEQTQKIHEDLIREFNKDDAAVPNEAQKEQITKYRMRQTELAAEIEELTQTIEAFDASVETSKRVRRAMAGTGPGVDVEDDNIVYRDMHTYAKDFLLTRQGQVASQIQQQFFTTEEIQRAHQRLELLKRVPANTLSSDVAGLTPPQHIAQIFQVIQTERPIVASALRAPLERGQLTYPQVDATPVVAVQGTQKTEAGNTGMDISMVTATASTYLGGGDLSWQAINWSTPNALELWFRFAAADYALKTEQDAAQVISHSAFSNNIASTIGGTPTFADLMTAIAAGGGDVYTNSGRMADTVYMAPDRYWYAVGLTSEASLSFGQSGQLNVNGESRNLNVVVSRGLDSGVIIVGDSDGLLVAETPGAPVELRVVEPAIGGVEVGIIGAFEAVVVDDGAFAMITTAS